MKKPKRKSCVEGVVRSHLRRILDACMGGKKKGKKKEE